MLTPLDVPHEFSGSILKDLAISLSFESGHQKDVFHQTLSIISTLL